MRTVPGPTPNHTHPIATGHRPCGASSFRLVATGIGPTFSIASISPIDCAVAACNKDRLPPGESHGHAAPGAEVDEGIEAHRVARRDPGLPALADGGQDEHGFGPGERFAKTGVGPAPNPQ